MTRGFDKRTAATCPLTGSLPSFDRGISFVRLGQMVCEDLGLGLNLLSKLLHQELRNRMMQKLHTRLKQRTVRRVSNQHVVEEICRFGDESRTSNQTGLGQLFECTTQLLLWFVG